MALISSSENPLAMRSMTVEGSCPDLNACMAVTMSAGLRPTSRGTVVSTNLAAGWQPEQAAAPAGASAGPAAQIVPAQGGPIEPRTNAAVIAMRVAFISEPPNYSSAPIGRVRFSENRHAFSNHGS